MDHGVDFFLKCEGDQLKHYDTVGEQLVGLSLPWF